MRRLNPAALCEAVIIMCIGMEVVFLLNIIRVPWALKCRFRVQNPNDVERPTKEARDTLLDRGTTFTKAAFSQMERYIQ